LGCRIAKKAFVKTSYSQGYGARILTADSHVQFSVQVFMSAYFAERERGFI
jgi:hypothetical protein